MMTIAEVAERIARECSQPDLRPINVDSRPGDVLKLQADTRVARQMLGFCPEVDFDEGIRRYIAWFRVHHNDFSALLEDDVRNWRMPEA